MIRVMFGSSAYDHVEDPADPAWIGHALVEPPAWWQRRSTWYAAGGSAIALALIVVGLLVVGARGDGNDDGASTARSGVAKSLAAKTTDASVADVIAPVIAPVDPDTSRSLDDPDRAIPEVSSGVRPNPVSADAPLTGPTGDVGLTAFVEHSDLPTLYINDGSGSAAGDASFDGWGATANLVGDLQGLDTLLRLRLDQLGVAMDVRLEVVSGFRTHEEQQALYAQYLAGTGNLAAVPGSSRHETGRAADIYVDGVALANVPGARAAAAKLGLGFPVGGEAWHTEITGSTG